MCDCNVLVHRGIECSSEGCHCHDEENVSSIAPNKRYDITLLIDDVTELQAKEIFDIIAERRGTYAGE